MQIAYKGDALLKHPGLAPDVAGEVDKIQAASRKLRRTLDETVWAVDPENDTLDGLAGYVIGLAQELLSGANVLCRFDFPDVLPVRTLRRRPRHSTSRLVNSPGEHGAEAQ